MIGNPRYRGLIRGLSVLVRRGVPAGVKNATDHSAATGGV
jgi:hypothetical protein